MLAEAGAHAWEAFGSNCHPGVLQVRAPAIGSYSTFYGAHELVVNWRHIVRNFLMLRLHVRSYVRALGAAITATFDRTRVLLDVVMTLGVRHQRRDGALTAHYLNRIRSRRLFS